MLGQGQYQDRYIRQQVLQERADQKQEALDKMIDEQKMDPNLAYKTLSTQYKQSVYEKPVSLPYETRNSFVGIGKQISLGFDQSHKVGSLNKTINNEMDQRLKQRKNQEFQKQLIQQREEEKRDTQQRKAFNTKDHLFEIKKKMGFQSLNSVNRQDIAFNQEFQRNADNLDHDYHIKKNDLNSFAEAYVKQKLTIRK